MTSSIWKFPLAEEIEMPKKAKVLTVQVQRDIPCIWAVVDPSADREVRRFVIVGTGHSMNRKGPYIGTFQLEGGALVFHVFEVES